MIITLKEYEAFASAMANKSLPIDAPRTYGWKLFEDTIYLKKIEESILAWAPKQSGEDIVDAVISLARGAQNLLNSAHSRLVYALRYHAPVASMQSKEFRLCSNLLLASSSALKTASRILFARATAAELSEASGHLRMAARGVTSAEDYVGKQSNQAFEMLNKHIIPVKNMLEYHLTKKEEKK